ncbi:hypothetical protein BQ8794_240029 [Mesorhizobium prunaredense]|uniref:Uncharacterized protein n=1 Tax=Mesorhizobium prunaredense TaxID=1631249 RepID=A0A1R3V7F9_9HYPH|nr:hypothetical protein BQ8794_240029 [Mesorhizobium prunaredense]
MDRFLDCDGTADTGYLCGFSGTDDYLAVDQHTVTIEDDQLWFGVHYSYSEERARRWPAAIQVTGGSLGIGGCTTVLSVLFAKPGPLGHA